MNKTRALVLAFVILALPLALGAQPEPEVVPDSPAMVTPIEAIAKTALVYLGYAAAIFAAIQGAKNTFPFLATLFNKYHKFGLVLSVAAAFVTQAILCLRMSPFDVLEVGKCLLTAVYQTLVTGGVHALYKAHMARGATAGRLMTADAGAGAPLSDAQILTPMREAAARAGK